MAEATWLIEPKEAATTEPTEVVTEEDDEMIKVFKYRPVPQEGWQIYAWEDRKTMLEMIEYDMDGNGSIEDYDEGPAFQTEVVWMTQKEFDNLEEFDGY